MVYSKKYTTRWHDTDASRRVRISRMLVYMQETSNCHMESCGPSLDVLRDKNGLAFLLSKIRMSIYKPLFAFEDIEVQTFTCDNHGFAIPRFYRIIRGDEVIADADTTWALMDLGAKTLVKGDILASLNDFENQAPISLDVPNRFKLPKEAELESIGQRRIVYSDLDYNMHMNNTHYPDMLLDFLPYEDTARVKGVFLSYLNEAAFGDTLDVRHAFKDGTHYFRTVSSSSKTCLEAEIILD